MTERLAADNRRSDRYRRFPPAEYERRHARVADRMADRDLDALVVRGGAAFRTTVVDYLANYRPSFETYLLVFRDPGAAPTLFVGLPNHLQYVREVSVVEDLRPLLPDPAGSVAERLRAADPERVGLVGTDPRFGGSMPHDHYRRLDDELDADLVDATAPVLRALSRRSEAELDRIRRAADLLDDAVEALAAAVEPGVREDELADALRAGVDDPEGRVTTTFVSSAPMDGAEPGEPLPWKATQTDRRLRAGDVVTTELSAAVGGYASQVHRPFAVDAAPTADYEALFDVARETYDRLLDALRPGNDAADVADALEPVAASPYRAYDVAVHGYGNGYLPPHVGTASPYWPGVDDPVTADWTFESGMVVVVQPNVVTPDERRALQLGSAVVVRDGAPEVLQAYPLRFTTT